MICITLFCDNSHKNGDFTRLHLLYQIIVNHVI